MNLSIIGFGKLGSPMAGAIAHKGHHVIGVDLNSASSARECAGAADVLILMPPCDEFRALGGADMRRGASWIDCGGLFGAQSDRAANAFEGRAE